MSTATYTIHPIVCGTLTASKSSLTYRTDREIEFAFPALAFLVVADAPEEETVILVDTGVKGSDSAYMRSRGRTVGEPGGGPKPVLDGLARHGFAPDDVATVVLTHLHHDHAANIECFPDAEFVVQRAEIAAAREPLPVLANTYIDGTVVELSRRTTRVIEGDETLLDGLSLVHTPGHSEGMQSVIVETTAGTHALIGDLAYVRHNLEPSLSSLSDANGTVHEITSVDAEYIPPGTHVDVAACYESIERVRRLVGPDGTLLASHDPSLCVERAK